MIFLLPSEEIGRERKEKEENRRKDKGTDDVSTLISNGKQHRAKTHIPLNTRRMIPREMY